MEDNIPVDAIVSGIVETGVVVPSVIVKAQPLRPVTCEAYLKSTGVRPHLINVMVSWAKSKGYEYATVQQFSDLFKSF
mgnify:CR=1 FL=1